MGRNGPKEGLIIVIDNLKMCIFSLLIICLYKRRVRSSSMMDFRAPRTLLISMPRGKFQSNKKDCAQPLTATLILGNTNPNDICAKSGRIREGSRHILTTPTNMANVNSVFLHCLPCTWMTALQIDLLVIRGRLRPESEWLKIRSTICDLRGDR